MFNPDLWFLFPVAVTIAVTGMSSGVSSSNFWIPVYMIWLGIEPMVGFWLSLLTMLFGYGSGVIRNLQQSTINWPLFRACLKFCLPAGMVGGALSPFAPQTLLLTVFAAFVLVYALWLLRGAMTQEQPTPTTQVPWKICLVGGFLQGLLATGLGKLMLPQLSRHQKIESHGSAAGTAVILVFTVSFAAVLVRLNRTFLGVLSQQYETILAIMIWVAPGVLLGGQLGPRVAKRLPEKYVKPYVAGLLIIVSGLMFYRAFK